MVSESQSTKNRPGVGPLRTGQFSIPLNLPNSEKFLHRPELCSRSNFSDFDSGSDFGLKNRFRLLTSTPNPAHIGHLIKGDFFQPVFEKLLNGYLPRAF